MDLGEREDWSGGWKEWREEKLWSGYIKREE